MSTFDELPRAVLVAISKLSDAHGGLIGGDDLIAELESVGFSPEHERLWHTVRRLRDDGFIKVEFAGGGSMDMIELDTRGRQEVEGWPHPGQASTAALSALLAVLNERAEDASLPEEERSKLRAAAQAVGSFAVNVSTSVAGAWAAKMTGVSPG